MTYSLPRSSPERRKECPRYLRTRKQWYSHQSTNTYSRQRTNKHRRRRPRRSAPPSTLRLQPLNLLPQRRQERDLQPPKNPTLLTLNPLHLPTRLPQNPRLNLPHHRLNLRFLLRRTTPRPLPRNYLRPREERRAGTRR